MGPLRARQCLRKTAGSNIFSEAREQPRVDWKSLKMLEGRHSPLSQFFSLGCERNWRDFWGDFLFFKICCYSLGNTIEVTLNTFSILSSVSPVFWVERNEKTRKKTFRFSPERCPGFFYIYEHFVCFLTEKMWGTYFCLKTPPPQRKLCATSKFLENSQTVAFTLLFTLYCTAHKPLLPPYQGFQSPGKVSNFKDFELEGRAKEKAALSLTADSAQFRPLRSRGKFQNPWILAASAIENNHCHRFPYELAHF